MTMTSLVRPATALALAALTLGVPAAFADEGHGHGHKDAIGAPGKAADAKRTVAVALNDIYFEPAALTVRAGETVRFLIVNKGTLLHEFNIGTTAMHAEHREEMDMMMQHGMITATGIDPDRMKMEHGDGKPMKHDDPNAALVEPGKEAEIVWTFPADVTLEFACNIPGHYEAGMVGPITIEK